LKNHRKFFALYAQTENLADIERILEEDIMLI